MKHRHFAHFAPHCPVCVSSGPLVLAVTGAEQDGDILAGILRCPATRCQYEFPIIDGIPVIVPDLAALMAQRGVDALLRHDLPDAVESLLGDALGPDSWFDVLRQGLSTYGWDAFADLAPDFAPGGQGPDPGAAKRCLDRLLALGAVPAGGGHAIDLGCAAGRTSFALAGHLKEALVLGVDTNLGLLRIARQAAAGRVRYPLRRIGLVYDRQDFAVSLAGAERVDFWVMDALALPLRPESLDVIACLNLLDCVAQPQSLLATMARLLRPDGSLLLATPFDWSARATRPERWIGGHSQRAEHRGAAETILRCLLDQTSLSVCGEDADWPWQTRLHARSSVQYRACLLALKRKEGLLF